MTREELKQLSAETFYDNNEGGITPYAHREFNDKLIDSIPDGTIQIPLTDIPVGYNMRGKTVTFTNTDKIPGNIIGFDDYYLRFKDINDFYIAAGQSGPGRGWAIWVTNGESSWTQYKYIYDANKTGWLLDTYTFPNDRDYIVESNSLPKHTATDWGFDYARVSGAIEDALSYKQDKLIAGTGINIASDGKTISAQTFTPTFIVDSDSALAQWAGNVSGNDYTYVLVTKGTWNYDNYIDLSESGTIGIVGEPGNMIKITTTSSFTGMGYTSLPSIELNTFCIGLNITFNDTALSSPYLLVGMKYMRNLKNCTSTVTMLRMYGGNAYCFQKCSNMEACYANATTSQAGSYAYGFDDCNNLRSCSSSATAYNDAHGFNNCSDLSQCSTTNIKGHYKSVGFNACTRLFSCQFSCQANQTYGFSQCNYLYGCTSVIGNSTDYTRHAYSECKNLYGCVSGVSLNTGTNYHYHNCMVMFGCAPNSSAPLGTLYSGCYMTTSGTTYAVGNNAAGGYNRNVY